MPKFIKARLGDKITLTDDATGLITTIEIDRTRRRSVSVLVDAPESVRIDFDSLQQRVLDADAQPGRHPRPVNESEAQA